MCYNKGKHIVELKDRVLVPWGPSSISAMAELVNQIEINFLDLKPTIL